MKRSQVFAAVLVGVACCGMGQAKAETQAWGQLGNILRDMSEKEVFIKAQQGLASQIGVTRIAAERAQNASVRELAQDLLQTFSGLQRQLRDLAKAQSMQVASEPTRMGQFKIKRLMAVSGTDVDRLFLRFEGRMLLKGVHACHQAIGLVQDHDAKLWFANLLVTLEETMQSVRQVKAGKIGDAGELDTDEDLTQSDQQE